MITENGLYDVRDYADVDVNVESSGGSGGDVETCTVTLNTTDPFVVDCDYIYCNVYSDGATQLYNGVALNKTIENVIVGSILVVCNVYNDDGGDITYTTNNMPLLEQYTTEYGNYIYVFIVGTDSIDRTVTFSPA